MRYLPIFCLSMLIFIPAEGQQGQKKILGRGNPIVGEKDRINIYLNFQDIYGLDLKEGTFCANFYTMMESDGKSASELSYLNGEVDNKYFDTTRKPYYEAWNNGKFRTHINFKDYPLDKQRLNIVIEAGEGINKTVLYTANKENRLIDEDHLEGWKIDGITTKTLIHEYTDFDYNDVHQPHKYYRIIFTIIIERSHKWIFLLKLFFPSFISMLILWIGFLFPPDKVETRFGLGIASIFGVISSLLLIQQNLPELARLTLIEILNYIAIITVFATLVIFGISNMRVNKAMDAKRFERVAFIVLVTFYVISSGGILFLRS
ncbi:MAG: hypothetical protein EPN39_20910 [Chitinophagaceae bacterium]|nr:MAG: hypothetical protein EPN39_20910 [Chitinophagaceae bacterium]